MITNERYNELRKKMSCQNVGDGLIATCERHRTQPYIYCFHFTFFGDKRYADNVMAMITYSYLSVSGSTYMGNKELAYFVRNDQRDYKTSEAHGPYRDNSASCYQHSSHAT